MKRIELPKNENIIDFVANNPKKCKGRKIFTNTEMVKRLSDLAENIEENGNSVRFNIICSYTGFLTKVDLVKEKIDRFWVKEITSPDIDPIGPVNTTKEPIRVINEPVIEKESIEICK